MVVVVELGVAVVVVVVDVVVDADGIVEACEVMDADVLDARPAFVALDEPSRYIDETDIRVLNCGGICGGVRSAASVLTCGRLDAVLLLAALTSGWCVGCCTGSS